MIILRQKIILISVIILLHAIMIMQSCQKEKDDLSTGFTDDIKNVVPDSTIKMLRDLGMIIYEGKKPPIIEGKFHFAPNLMDSSNVPNERHKKGHKFADYKYFLYQQNSSDLIIKMDSKALSIFSGDTSVIGSSIGEGGFLSGYGNEFSVFIIS